MRFLDENRPITIVCGHYGAGKTNVAVNMALDGIKYIPDGKKLILIDMDIVNPYFRSSDNKAMLEDAGVEHSARPWNEKAFHSMEMLCYGLGPQ